jgi:hypothetical protein
MGQRALNCFQAEFQIEASAESFISAVNEVLSRRRVRLDVPARGHEKIPSSDARLRDAT